MMSEENLKKLEFLKNNYGKECYFSHDGKAVHVSVLCGLSDVCTDFLGFVDDNGNEYEMCEVCND